MCDKQNVCEMLGYSRKTRLLIINADDFGLCYSENEGTIQAIQSGLVSSCSLMLPAPWSLHAIHQLQAHQLPFAVHLTLVSEYIHYRWGPVAPRDQVPSLLDSSGYFPPDSIFKACLAKANLGEIEKEFRAQIETVLSTGLKPTHLDSHYHTHEHTEAIFEITVKLAIEYGLALRTSRHCTIKKLQQAGYPTNDHPVLDSGRIPPAEKLLFLTNHLRELPAGLSEWAVHPARSTDELRAVMADPLVPNVTGTPEGRSTDLEFLISKEAISIVKDEGIEILSYEPLQRLWQRKQ